MLAKATAKINAEMQAAKQDAYVQYVGAYLLEYLAANPAVADKLAADGKTIAGSLSEMKKVAQTKKVGNVGVIAPQEGLAIVLKYYGIEAGQVVCPSVSPVIAPVPAKAVDFDVQLDDLL